MGSWKLEGHDTFSREQYRLPGEYASEAQAQAAARERLKQFDRSQPAVMSGGQAGVQDGVYIVRPDGTSYPYVP
jgi:hypothetical protein